MLEYVGPYLIVANLLLFIVRKGRLSGRGWTIAALAVSVVVTFLPIFGGLSVGDSILSANPNFSVSSVALLLAFIWKTATGRSLLGEKDITVLAAFCATVYLIVTASALGFIPQDIYFRGYGFSAWFLAVAAFTIWLSITGSRVSYVLIACALAYVLKLLPSDNFFDYLTDGVMLMMSAGILLVRLSKRYLSRWRLPSRSPVYENN